MIVRSSFRSPGGLTRHLQRCDHNERVVVRADLSPDGASDIGLALRDYVLMAGAYVRSEAVLVHIILSPSQPLSPAAEAHAIGRVRAIYGIAQDRPMLAVQHVKPGDRDRPAHFHFVLPRVDPEGPRGSRGRPRAISDTFSRIKNERLSLEIAADLGQALVAGPHLDAVRSRLAVDRPDLIQALANLAPPRRDPAKTTVSDKAELFDAGSDRREFDRRVFAAFCDNNLGAVRLTLARGNRAMMVVDELTGGSQSLARVVARESKRLDRPIVVSQEALEKRFGKPEMSVGEAKRVIVTHGLERLQAELESELRAQAFEAVSNFDSASLEQARQAHRFEQARCAEHMARARATLAADQREFLRRKSELARLKTHRAQQASRRGRIWFRSATPRARTLSENAIPAITGISTMTIAGMIAQAAKQVALVAGDVEGRPSNRQRSKASAAGIEREDSFSDIRAAQSFDISAIPQGCRIPAGALCHFLMEDTEDQKLSSALDRCMPGLSRKICDLVDYGLSAKMRDACRALYDPENILHRRAVAVFKGASALPLLKKLKSRGKER